MTIAGPQKSLDLSYMPQAARSMWRQVYDRLFVLGPIVSVALFVVAIGSVLWYLQREEVQRERDNLRRDTEWARQKVRIKLSDLEDHLGRLAREMSAEEPDSASFKQTAEELLREHPMLVGISLSTAEMRVRYASFRPPTITSLVSNLKVGEALASKDSRSAFDAAKTVETLAYSRAYPTPEGVALIEMHAPVQRRGYFGGMLIATISLPNVLRYYVPAEAQTANNAYSLLDSSGRELASTAAGPLEGALLTHEVAATPNGAFLYMRGATYRTTALLMRSGMLWIVIGLSGLTLTVLVMSWFQIRNRLRTQQRLISETNFRRAMENSMSTGMRAIDMQGRITYVNPAFCRMTGLEESELVGSMPPYAYWPDSERDELTKIVELTLQNRAPISGFEVPVLRKDGSILDARMYVSPLVDSKGRHVGYMTSMTDITEPKRIREELSNAHERFTAVLEGLDAAVSVVNIDSGAGEETLLFSNRAYRQWFGPSVAKHLELVGNPLSATSAQQDSFDNVDSFAGLPANELLSPSAQANETYAASLDKWFDVRQRYLQWVDGRLVQMLIATDITSRRRSEDMARAQEERAQNASRLITMGEMASSLAHELNQPLTAISNYCVGIIARVKSNRIDPAALEEALQKTARQAQRAAGIIARVRSFVKKSAPNRSACDVPSMVEAALELADLELKKHNVRFEKRIELELPELWVDRILIEQVLLNLIKNGAESVDAAGRPYGRRQVRLQIGRDADAVLFAVSDSGAGLPEGFAEKLFDSFYSTKADGMGMGLNICRSIVESHQGRLWAENDYNSGAVAGCTFRFSLPLRLAEQLDKAPDETASITQTMAAFEEKVP